MMFQFEERYVAPAKGNPYYTTVNGGGYNKCIAINGTSVLPNCTGYAWGRFMEIGQMKTCRLSTGDAQNWWNHADGYKRGQTPKIGAVMCWGKAPGGKYGHVAIVEEVYDDGTVVASMSNWSEKQTLPYFERRAYVPPYNTSSGLPFQGFIYNPAVEIPVGASDIGINANSYAIYRQGEKEMPVVLSAGLNKLAPIRDLDSDVYVMAKVTGANYFQMRTDQADPYGTTYGDLSAPLNDVWTETPNQDTTLYEDLDTGVYGDCTGVHVSPGHNVFSPAVVFPAKGNYQYARMVGIDHVNTVSRYSFVIRFHDGTYAVGIANDDCTPRAIAADFRALLGADLDSIAFLDGGGSAQMGRWNGKTFEYVRDTGRECPSAVAIISTEPMAQVETPTEPEITPETGEIQGETEKDEEQTMSEEKPVNEPEKVEKWNDPETTEPAESTVATIAKRFLSVKSVVTLALTAIFCILSYNKTISTEQFMSIFTMCISFFFGYSFEKKQNNGGSK